MLSRFNTKTLVAVLVFLVALFIILLYTDHTDSSFKTELVVVDTAVVNKISIEIPGKDTATLIKENGKWYLLGKDGKMSADANKVKALLARVSPLKTLRLATTSKKQWEKYGVGEKDRYSAIRFYDGKKLLGDVILGKVDFQAPEADEQNPYMRGNQGVMIGYVRSGKDDEVYVIDGYLKLTFAGDVKSYRNKELIKLNPSDITNVDFQSGEAHFSLAKKDDHWWVDDQKADSANTVKFINNISRLNGYDYFSKKEVGKIKPVGTVNITAGNNLVTVKAYAVDSVNFALESSVNENNMIKDKKGRIFNRLFKEKQYFEGK
jgi:hypothetical protein